MRSRIKFVAIVLIAILVIIFAYFLQTGNKDSDINFVKSDTLTLDSGKIHALHNIEKNAHMIVGSVVLPTPCHELVLESVVAQSMPEQVTLLFSTQNRSDFCTQMITEKYFEIKFEADKNAKIKAVFDNAPIDLILQNADENDITNFIIENKWKTKI